MNGLWGERKDEMGKGEEGEREGEREGKEGEQRGERESGRDNLAEIEFCPLSTATEMHLQLIPVYSYM